MIFLKGTLPLCILILAYLAPCLPLPTKHDLQRFRTRLRTAHGSKHPALHNILEMVQVHNLTQSHDPQIVLHVNSTVLHTSGEWFEVSWSGVPNPAYDDWIALMVPADGDPSQTAPAKFKYAAESPTHVKDGKGTLRFQLISYRHDMAFLLVRNGFAMPTAVAKSPVIRVKQPNQPLQAHLALTGKPGQMQVQWNTLDSSSPQVKWGSRPGKLSQSAAARSFTYGKDDMCAAPANTIGWVDAGTHHIAVMTGLTPGQRYYYVVGDEADGFSAERSFVAAPQPGPEAVVKILAVADMGQAESDGSLEGSMMIPSLNTTARMAQDGSDYTLLLHNGDISYARGYATQWDNFFHQLEPLASRMPYMVAPGNHERDWPGSGDLFGVYDSGGECGVTYEKRITMPLAGRDQLWYSFDYGPIHFLQYSTEHDVAPGSPQYEFIAADLQSVNRSITPWLVVGGHRPMYISSSNSNLPDGDQPVSQMLRDNLEDMLMEYKVDLTISGHHHSYQRTCPVYRQACQGYQDDGSASAPVHVVIGHGGAGLSLNVAYPAPVWLEEMGLWWGYMRMEASGTHMSIEIVSDEDGSLMDSFRLTKSDDWAKVHMAQRVQALKQIHAASKK